MIRSHPFVRGARGLAALVLVAAAACSGNDDGGSPDGTGSTAPPSAGGTQSWPLGEYEEVGSGRSCLPGAGTCQQFEVTCPGVREPARGDIDVRPADGRARGVVVLFSSSGGGSWWPEDNPPSAATIDELRAGGLTVVQVAWKRVSWLFSAPGEDAGTARVACRPATVLRWIYDNMYAPLDVEAEPLHCGFCAAGVSGGASQVAYALAYYGLDEILDVAALLSGPPHADLVRGCLRESGDEALWVEAYEHIDGSYGFRDGAEGPCARHDAEMTDRWRAESVATGGNDYVHPDTRIQFILGAGDESGAAGQGQAYAARLQAEGSPHVEVEVLGTMAHGLDKTGLARLAEVLLA